MAANLAEEGQRLAKKVILVQVITVLAGSGITLLLFDLRSGLAIFAGGMMSVIPNGIFAVLVFRYSGASKNRLVVRSFTQGSRLKLISTVILGILAFKGLGLAPLPLFVGFIVTTISQWLGMVNVQAKKYHN